MQPVRRLQTSVAFAHILHSSGWSKDLHVMHDARVCWVRHCWARAAHPATQAMAAYWRPMGVRAAS